MTHLANVYMPYVKKAACGGNVSCVALLAVGH